jgi:hypothetical protein
MHYNYCDSIPLQMTTPSLLLIVMSPTLINQSEPHHTDVACQSNIMRLALCLVDKGLPQQQPQVSYSLRHLGYLGLVRARRPDQAMQ